MTNECKLPQKRNWSIYWSGNNHVICAEVLGARCSAPGTSKDVIRKKNLTLEEFFLKIVKDNSEYQGVKYLGLHHSDVDWGEIDTFMRLANNRCINWVLLGATGEVIDSNDKDKIGEKVKIKLGSDKL